MLFKLQRKTLIPAQIIGYAFTLLIGVAIVMLIFQLYSDIKPLLTQQTDVFKSQAVTVSKNVTLFKTADKDRLGFSKEEIQDLKDQDFVSRVAPFTSATFHVSASIDLGENSMFTEMFFESVPDDYLDVLTDKWQWDLDSQFLPVIIPEDYLSLYNFGFAESQALPVISKATIEQVSFNIYVSGNGNRRDFESRIVGFSNKINTILVPDNFLNWANSEFGKPDQQHTTRLLVEFTDASDERIPAYFEEHRLNVKENELQSSKLMFFLRIAVLFVFAVASIIIVLSMAFIIMSMNLIVQKNRDLFRNLYNIGYSSGQISRYYQLVISIITVIDILIAALLAVIVRYLYLNRLSTLFETHSKGTLIWIIAGILVLLLPLVYDLLIQRTITKTVKK